MGFIRLLFYATMVVIFLSGCGSNSGRSASSDFFTTYGLEEGDIVIVGIVPTIGTSGEEVTTQSGGWTEGSGQTPSTGPGSTTEGGDKGLDTPDTTGDETTSQASPTFQSIYSKDKSVVIDEGTTLQLSAVAFDITGQDYPDPPVVWESDNKSVAIVNEAGVVTAISPGEALITAKMTLQDGSTILDSVVVTVLPAPVKGKIWKISNNPLPQPLWDHGSAIYNGFLYTSGGHSGCDGNYGDCGFTKKVYYAPIYPDGSVGSFNVTTSLPIALRGHSMLAYNGYIYIIGGIVQPQFSEPPFPDPETFETILNEKVYYAKINSDGTLSSWNETAPLPPSGEDVPADKAGLFALSATVHKDYIYVSGGWSDVLKRNVNILFTGRIDKASGAIINWVHNATSDLPDYLSKHVLVAAAVNGSDYLYIIGGNSGTIGSQSFHKEIHYSKIATDGIPGKWTLASKTLPVPLIDHAAVVAGRYLFVLGGRDRDASWGKYNKYSSVYYFYIKDNGDIDGPSKYPDLPVSLFHHAVVSDIWNDSIRLFVTGGAGGDTEDPGNRYDYVFYLDDEG